MTTSHAPSLNVPLDRTLLQRAAKHRRIPCESATRRSPHAFTILVPIDFSRDSGEAATLAAKIGAPLHARFVLLHILPRAVGPDFDADADRDEMRKRKALAKMNVVASALRHVTRDVPFEIRIRSDCAHLGIVREAFDACADLIVMARHGCSTEASAHLGRTADYAIRHAPCAVLLAPGPGDQ